MSVSAVNFAFSTRLDLAWLGSARLGNQMNDGMEQTENRESSKGISVYLETRKKSINSFGVFVEKWISFSLPCLLASSSHTIFPSLISV